MIWCWDIIEPIAYFSTLAGSIFLSLHFFRYYDDYSNDTYFNWQVAKETEKIMKTKHFDKIAHRQL